MGYNQNLTMYIKYWIGYVDVRIQECILQDKIMLEWVVELLEQDCYGEISFDFLNVLWLYLLFLQIFNIDWYILDFHSIQNILDFDYIRIQFKIFIDYKFTNDFWQIEIFFWN